MSHVPPLLGEMPRFDGLMPGCVLLSAPMEEDAILVNHPPPFPLMRALDVQIEPGAITLARQDQQPFRIKTFGYDVHDVYRPMLIYYNPVESLTFYRDAPGSEWGIRELEITPDNKPELVDFANILAKFVTKKQMAQQTQSGSPRGER